MNNAPPISVQFDHARNQTEYEKFQLQFRQDAQQDKAIAASFDAGNMTEEQSLRRVNASMVEKDETGRPRNKNDKNKNTDRLVFRAMLKQLDKQVAAVQQKMNELYEKLQSIYGDDVIGGVAATHLSPDVLDRLKTEEDKMKALVELMLNPDGTIKDKYKDLFDAQYVHAWQQLQELKMTEPKHHPEYYEDKHASVETRMTTSQFIFGS